ncbi:hypothetical protein CMV_009451 [Castanea mollissima]|uniref:Uncharacterized protein n=1 Tax=Castanea mollissima TaxID=60419 RepID=A0A8J4RLX9_9ROSI|nr:hypothetical protein CMV_009451 [Castanea mollissima]
MVLVEPDPEDLGLDLFEMGHGFAVLQKRREKKTFLRRQVLEAARKLPALGVGSNEKERPFWLFSDETKAGLIGTGDFRQRSSGGGARQWLWR